MGVKEISDWIDGFVKATNGVPSPEDFRLWTAISTISGALERKTWTEGSARPIYPNLYTLLVGPPGSGKTNAIWKGRELWRGLKGMKVAPDNVTKASLMDVFVKALKTDVNAAGTQMTAYSPLAVACSEFGVFFTSHDTEFLSAINEIYEGPPNYTEERRTSTDVTIVKPNLVLLAGTQPDFLGTFLPEEAWGMGFTSRLIMIFSGEAPKINILGPKIDHDVSHLLPALESIYNLRGEFLWTDEAMTAMNAWGVAGCPPHLEHNKLKHYNARRAVHSVKLSMVAAASRAGSLTVTLEDFERAQDWLLTAEKKMPDIFHSMAQKSDAQVLEDLHMHVYQIYSSVARENRKPIRDEVLHNFLSDRVPSWQVEKIIDLAAKMGLIKPGTMPDEWVPRPKLDILTGGKAG